MNVSRSTLLFFWYSNAYYIEQFVKSMPVKAAFEVCPAGAPSFVFWEFVRPRLLFYSSSLKLKKQMKHKIWNKNLPLLFSKIDSKIVSFSFNVLFVFSYTKCRHSVITFSYFFSLILRVFFDSPKWENWLIVCENKNRLVRKIKTLFLFKSNDLFIVLKDEISIWTFYLLYPPSIFF